MKKALKAIANGFAWFLSLFANNLVAKGCEYLSAQVKTCRFRRKLKSHGKGLSVRRGSKFEGLKCVSIGDNFTAQEGLWLAANRKYKEYAYEPEIIFGNEVHLSRFVHISAIERIELKDNVLIGSNVLINDHNHGATDDFSAPRHTLPLVGSGPIFIGEKSLSNIGCPLSSCSTLLFLVAPMPGQPTAHACCNTRKLQGVFHPSA